MSKIQWILFSRDRTLQAKSCIKSLVHFASISAEDITVLYDDSEKVSYDPLKKEFACRFVKQKKDGDFYSTIRNVINGIRKPYVSLLVDDLIFRDSVDCAMIERIMDRRPDVDAFSLRLGKNIKLGPIPDFEELEPGILTWKTERGLGKHWNIFMEISSSIYRREAILEYLNRCTESDIKYPNDVEIHYQRITPNHYVTSLGVKCLLRHPQYFLWSLFAREKMSKRYACYEKSRSFTQGINMAAPDQQNFDIVVTTEKLHELYNKGYWIDYDCLKDIENSEPNAGVNYFRLVGPNNEIHPLSIYK